MCRVDMQFVALLKCGYASQKGIGLRHALMCQMRDAIFWQGEANHSALSQIQRTSGHSEIERSFIFFFSANK